jgi:hypothetical protein
MAADFFVSIRVDWRYSRAKEWVWQAAKKIARGIAEMSRWIVTGGGAAQSLCHRNLHFRPIARALSRRDGRFQPPGAKGAPYPCVAMSFRNYLSACLCFKDANRYLAEWLAFYSALGVEHFFLYDNESSDDFRSVIAPYCASGCATLLHARGRGIQQAVYAHCLSTFGARTRWLMFCDDDEFFFPVKDTLLPNALAPYEEFAGLAASWMLYGSAGHWTQPRGLVIENYAMRFAVPDQHVKCIVDPQRIVRPVVIGHQFECVEGQVIVDENGEAMHGPLNPRPSAAVFRINHYLTKSRAEMIERRQRIQANTGVVSPLSIGQWIDLEATWNQVRDPLAARYGDRVREMAGTRERVAPLERVSAAGVALPLR